MRITMQPHVTHLLHQLLKNDHLTYVRLYTGPGRTLIPSQLGMTLVHGYKRIDADLVLPDVRAAIEHFCDLVSRAQADKETVVQHSLRNFEQKYRYVYVCISITCVFSMTYNLPTLKTCL